CKDIIPEFFKTRYFYATKTVNFFAEEPRARLVSSAKIGVKLGRILQVRKNLQISQKYRSDYVLPLL
ncbi:hypothetical protein, partial [Turicimonas muris]